MDGSFFWHFDFLLKAPQPFTGLFLSTFGVKIDVKNKRKRVSRMCENAYLSIKNPKASRALKQPLDTGRRMLASLARLRFAMSATFRLRSWGPPLDQILDPHLYRVSLYTGIGMNTIVNEIIWNRAILLVVFLVLSMPTDGPQNEQWPKVICVLF